MGITGARWDLEGAQAILWLRAIRANGDLDTYWTGTSPKNTTATTSAATSTASTRRMTSLEKSHTHVTSPWRPAFYTVVVRSAQRPVPVTRVPLRLNDAAAWMRGPRPRFEAGARTHHSEGVARTQGEGCADAVEHEAVDPAAAANRPCGWPVISAHVTLTAMSGAHAAPRRAASSDQLSICCTLVLYPGVSGTGILSL
jgi:hypothetical protein